VTIIISETVLGASIRVPQEGQNVSSDRIAA
jgi:hypothetical protein